ncbi:MAG: rRNA pseudouridine synthase [Deltaproteobacteria bacterium]|nr:rRNA pseudouridine synthase [Deltaproteobacteria bacterium]
MKERIQKLMARAGLASRRRSEQFIREGRVAVNGTVVTELGDKADWSKDTIEVDGCPLMQAQDKVYILLHKPHGYITSLNDPQERPTIAKLVDNIPERIFPVGRLDYDTEGLLVLTNDGSFAHIMQHPRHNIKRTYLVKVKGLPSRRKIESLKKGMHIDGVKTNKVGLRLMKRTKQNSWFEVVLKEGRYHQIKNMFKNAGHAALRIKRTRFGPLRLDDLPTGEYRFLRKEEIEEIKESGRLDS